MGRYGGHFLLQGGEFQRFGDHRRLMPKGACGIEMTMGRSSNAISHQMLYIEDKCHRKEVDWREKVHGHRAAIIQKQIASCCNSQKHSRFTRSSYLFSASLALASVWPGWSGRWSPTGAFGSMISPMSVMYGKRSPVARMVAIIAAYVPPRVPTPTTPTRQSCRSTAKALTSPGNCFVCCG